MKMNSTAAFCAGLLSGQLLFASEPAQTPETTATVKPAAESELVVASRKRKATPRKKAKLSITDKDVKQSRGKLIILPPTEESRGEAKAQPLMADPLAIEKATVELERTLKEVSVLETQLLQHEQEYYNEDNASFRDEIIVQRFNVTRRKLEQARLDLAAAREARAKLDRVAGQ